MQHEAKSEDKTTFELALQALGALAGLAGPASDTLILLASAVTNQRYAILNDGTVIRNRAKKPLLHNGKAPRR